ncbi:hypothetical protein RCH23_001021 [Cryobacterium sp. CAN_C3]|nr:hypothetical protein [Cryobacterium sp. CAN_C3]
MKSVAANPSRTSTKSFPAHHGNRRSSIWIEPDPLKLSCATRRYTGRAPRRVKATNTMVAIGDSKPAARAAMAGWYPRVEK